MRARSSLVYWLIVPPHALLPWGVWVLYQHSDFDVTTKVIAALHVVFPVLYVLVRKRIPLTDAQIGRLLLLDHLAIAIGAGVLAAWLAST